MGQDPEPTAYLIHRAEPDEPPVRIPIDALPFVIGRGATANFVLHSMQISKEHAVIDRRRHRYLVRDLGSRNGTFVNGERVLEACYLEHGDLLHVATRVFEFRSAIAEEFDDEETESTIVSEPDIQELLLLGSRDLLRIIAERAVQPVFQPIVSLPNRTLVGYEALSRNALDGASYSPIQLFRMAASQNRSAELSRMMRTVTLEAAKRLPPNIRLFLNLHPAEMGMAGLTESLEAIPAALGPGQRPIVEIHEAAVTDLDAMRALRAQLKDLGVGLAYDDFGAGQSRLMELAEVPPDVIKLDRSLIQGINDSQPRQDLVRALVKVMLDQGSEVLAEGVETESECAVCYELGCQLAQGFLIHHPATLDDLTLR